MPGLLLVYSDPGSNVTPEEFNDWYDNEHVPLRIPIPGFQSWSRWTAVDGQHPTYPAIYDLSSPSVISQPPYADLANTRSEREKSILSRIALLDRRTYELLEPVYPPKAGDAYDPAKPGAVLSIIEVDIKPVPGAEEDFHKWYDGEHIPLLAKVPGWVRSRRFVLVDSGAIGSEAKGERPPKFLAIHEWESADVFERSDFKAASETEWTKRILGNLAVFKRRRMTLLRAWNEK
ncbi:hypothetical protein BN946_scf184707.g10 [Trametes cinnabarina]|uniref:EthD domain-containing protein n=1 Tax=Pycnoporus cinnabarinus TaxID=5643 RepID=A0A060S834_PYCCI|nr:hypothetical protein BN946_scf184707.g10 [Trametes cinnabarina]